MEIGLSIFCLIGWAVSLYILNSYGNKTIDLLTTISALKLTLIKRENKIFLLEREVKNLEHLLKEARYTQ